MSDLGRQRGDLQIAYAKTNEAVAIAQKTCREASAAVQIFDAEHPEVMRAVHAAAGEAKAKAHADAIAAASEVAE